MKKLGPVSRNASAAFLFAALCVWSTAAVWDVAAARRAAAAPPQNRNDASALTAGGPTFTAGGELVRPADYREWTFVSSGLGMTYGPSQPAAGSSRPPMFDNVFVTRSAYRTFVDTGAWPDKTMFILEIRRSLENVSINNGGRTQGEVALIEAAVKDVQRFKDTGGWAYFDFGGGERLAAAAKPLPTTASCYSCHSTNTAVEKTFVQFYPDLLAAAKKHGTIKPSYDPARKP
jgi:hypothetical protein